MNKRSGGGGALQKHQIIDHAETKRFGWKACLHNIIFILPVTPLIHPLLTWPPKLCAYYLPLWLSRQLKFTLEIMLDDKRQNTKVKHQRRQSSLHPLTKLSQVISFLYFLLRTSFETSRGVFINPIDRKRMQVCHSYTSIADTVLSVFPHYLGLYRQQDSLLVLTLWPWIKILMRGSMYRTAAYALNDLLSGFLWEEQHFCSMHWNKNWDKKEIPGQNVGLFSLDCWPRGQIMCKLYSHSFSRCPSHQYVLVICLHIQLWFSVVHQLQIIDDHKSTLKQN